jgi:hypothetical protein
MGLGPILFGSCSLMVDCSMCSTSQKRFKLDFRQLSSRDRNVHCEPFCVAASVRPQTVQPKTLSYITGKFPGHVHLPGRSTS